MFHPGEGTGRCRTAQRGRRSGVGEGLPFVGQRELVDGSPGRVLGEEDRWVLAWEGPAPCRDMAIVGNDISRGAFETALQGADILP